MKASRAKASAVNPTFECELDVGFSRLWVAGTDEVGRGCLAGDVYAAAVILPREWCDSAGRISDQAPQWLFQVRDSKQLRSEVREELAQKIKSDARAFSVACATVAEIDSLNILWASLLAMERALANLKPQAEIALVDGNRVPRSWVGRAQAVVKGDQRSLSIACAAILAKVARDQAMTELDSLFPGYGFSEHKGYPTPVHLQALADRGITPCHRKGFGPVRALISAQ